MANNNNLFNAALAGAAAGASSRWITNANAAFYNAQSALMNTFATEFDAAIAPIVGGGSKGQSLVVYSLAQSIWRDRTLTSSTDFSSIITPLVALFSSVNAYVLADADSGSGVSPVVAENIAVADDGVAEELLSINVTANVEGLFVVGVAIDPDVADEMPAGVLTVSGPDGDHTFEWGPITPGGVGYLTFSGYGTGIGTYTLSATVTNGTGACVVTQASMFLIQL
jgi:hypothetical protein